MNNSVRLTCLCIQACRLVESLERDYHLIEEMSMRRAMGSGRMAGFLFEVEDPGWDLLLEADAAASIRDRMANLPKIVDEVKKEIDNFKEEVNQFFAAFDVQGANMKQPLLPARKASIWSIVFRLSNFMIVFIS